MVRLLTINAVNAYVTLTVLSLTGGFDDPRLLLPGWIGIATVRLAVPAPCPYFSSPTWPSITCSAAWRHIHMSV